MRGSLAAAPRNSNVAASNLVATGVSTQLVAPVANFTSSSTTICAGQSVVFTDLSCKGNPSVRSWTLTGSSTPSSTSASPTVIYQTPGTYNVSLMAQNSYGGEVQMKMHACYSDYCFFRRRIKNKHNPSHQLSSSR
jgi:PKD repeat protein